MIAVPPPSTSSLRKTIKDERKKKRKTEGLAEGHCSFNKKNSPRTSRSLLCALFPQILSRLCHFKNLQARTSKRD